MIPFYRHEKFIALLKRVDKLEINLQDAINKLQERDTLFDKYQILIDKLDKELKKFTDVKTTNKWKKI